MTFTGTLRVYFNRHGAAPLMWCVSPAPAPITRIVPWEIAVRSVPINCASFTVYEAKATPDDDDGKPSAWIEAAGTLTVGADGHAVIR